MKEVTMYQCEYCDKYFKTPNRHKCKYDPDMKSCFSCNNNKEFYKETNERYFPDHTEECDTVCVVCVKDNVNAEQEVQYMDRNMQCDDYEYCGDKWFNNRFEGYRTNKMIKHSTNIPW